MATILAPADGPAVTHDAVGGEEGEHRVEVATRERLGVGLHDIGVAGRRLHAGNDTSGCSAPDVPADVRHAVEPVDDGELVAVEAVDAVALSVAGLVDRAAEGDHQVAARAADQ